MDVRKAVEWLKEACEVKGHPAACYDLAMLYMNGEGEVGREGGVGGRDGREGRFCYLSFFYMSEKPRYTSHHLTLLPSLPPPLPRSLLLTPSSVII